MGHERCCVRCHFSCDFIAFEPSTDPFMPYKCIPANRYTCCLFGTSGHCFAVQQTTYCAETGRSSSPLKGFHLLASFSIPMSSLFWLGSHSHQSRWISPHKRTG